MSPQYGVCRTSISSSDFLTDRNCRGELAEEDDVLSQHNAPEIFPKGPRPSPWCSVGKRSDREHLVWGYTRSSIRPFLGTQIVSNLILKFYDLVAYWDFDSLDTFEQSEYRQILRGPRVRFNDLVFQCTLCPRGWSHKDSISFFVEFDKEAMSNRLPVHVQSVTCYLVIYCEQIEYEYRTAKKFKNVHSAQGWPAYRVDDIRLRDFDSLNFGCYIELLEVNTAKPADGVGSVDGPIGHSVASPSMSRQNSRIPLEAATERGTPSLTVPPTATHSVSDDHYGAFLNREHRMSSTSRSEWIVDGDLLDKFKAAKHSQSFHSPNFDGGSWCLSCSPSGIKREYDGEFCIALRLLRLQFGMTAAKVRHSIRIRSDDAEFDIDLDDVKVFNYKRRASRFNVPMDGNWSFADAKWISIAVEVRVEEEISAQRDSR